MYKNNFFSWAALWDAAPAGRPATHWRSLWMTESLLTASWDWIKTHCISRGVLHISFHNAHTFPLNHVTAFVYLRRCVLWRESLIDGSIMGQYATSLSTLFFKMSTCGHFSRVLIHLSLHPHLTKNVQRQQQQKSNSYYKF